MCISRTNHGYYWLAHMYGIGIYIGMYINIGIYIGIGMYVGIYIGIGIYIFIYIYSKTGDHPFTMHI